MTLDYRPTVETVIESLKNHTGTTTYSGPCSIGATIENVVGINLNNDVRSDTITHEMKTTEGKCDVTLFTRSPERGDTYDIVLNYGYYDKKDRRSYMKDIRSNTPEIFCKADKNGIGVYDRLTENEICYWGHTHCMPGYEKITNILKVTTSSKNQVGNKKNYSVDQITTFNGFNLDKFIELVNSGAISISPRRYFKSLIPNENTGKYPSRDRGCAFRVKQQFFKELYSSIEEK